MLKKSKVFVMFLQPFFPTIAFVPTCVIGICTVVVVAPIVHAFVERILTTIVTGIISLGRFTVRLHLLQSPFHFVLMGGSNFGYKAATGSTGVVNIFTLLVVGPRIYTFVIHILTTPETGIISGRCTVGPFHFVLMDSSN